MDPDVKTAWVDALRSGRYLQGHGRLVRYVGDRYEHCCLGVLCEIAADKGIVTRSSVGYRERVHFEDRVSYTSTSTLPPAVQNWAGLNSDCGRLSLSADERGPLSLVELNDGSGRTPRHTFREIADIIEREF